MLAYSGMVESPLRFVAAQLCTEGTPRFIASEGEGRGLPARRHGGHLLARAGLRRRPCGVPGPALDAPARPGPPGRRSRPRREHRSVGRAPRGPRAGGADDLLRARPGQRGDAARPSGQRPRGGLDRGAGLRRCDRRRGLLPAHGSGLSRVGEGRGRPGRGPRRLHSPRGVDLLKIDIEGAEWALLADPRFEGCAARGLAGVPPAPAPRLRRRAAGAHGAGACGYAVLAGPGRPGLGVLWGVR